MTLPPPIQAYFEADRLRDVEALLAIFVANAVVKDEGRTHSGHPAIAAWMRAARNQYQHVVEPLDWAEADNVHRVRSRVAGDFPGSPVTLTFAFNLQGDRISHLEIGA